MYKEGDIVRIKEDCDGSIKGGEDGCWCLDTNHKSFIINSNVRT